MEINSYFNLALVFVLISFVILQTIFYKGDKCDISVQKLQNPINLSMLSHPIMSLTGN